MKKILVFSISFLLVGASLWAQSNQTESLTITTYYPAPYGVYKMLRLLPNNDFSPGNNCAQEGDTSFDRATSELYVCKGPVGDRKWRGFGSGGSSGNLVYTNNGVAVIADTCSGILRTPDALSRTCSVPFYKDITFPSNFSSPPAVAVSVQWATNSWNPWPGIWATSPRTNCAASGTDKIVAYPTNITVSGFRLWASGSPEGSNCGGGSYFSHVYAAWIAIGD